MSFLGKIFGGLGSNEGVIEELKPIVEQINALEPEFKKLSDAKLKAKTLEFRKRLGEGETLDDILPEAFAAVREASKRTLVATLPMYLNALSGDGAHLITVNDYLARRDATWMWQIYNALGLSVGALNHEVSYLY